MSFAPEMRISARTGYSGKSARAASCGLVFSLGLACAAAAADTGAGEPACSQPPEERPGWREAWQLANLFDRGVSGTPGALRCLRLSGRLHADAAHFDADQGDWNDVLWRRFRFGFVADFTGGWTAHLEGAFNLDDFDDDFYGRLTDAYLKWKPASGGEWKFLKQSAGFTLDGATSSRMLLTPQRNNLTRNLWFTAEYFTGVQYKHSVGEHWQYKAGAFSTDGDNEFSAFSADFFGLLSVSRCLGAKADCKKSNIRLDYVYNNEHPDSNTPDLTQVISLSSQVEGDNWGLRADLGAGEGHYEQSDLWGLVVMPYYTFSDIELPTQLVLRYTYLDSTDANGLRLGRYEDRVVSGQGDRYNELFGGVNVFLYGHRLKWQTGLQYTEMDDAARDGGEYQGWGITSVLRMFW